MVGPTWVSRDSAHHGHLGTGLIETPTQNQSPQLPRQGRGIVWPMWHIPEGVCGFFFLLLFLFKFHCNEVHTKGEGEAWGTCSGHRNTILWPEPQLLSCGTGMKRKGQAGAEVEEGRGKQCGCIPPTPRKHLQALDPAPHLPWSPRSPSLVLLLALVALSFATSLVFLCWGVFFGILFLVFFGILISYLF